MSTPIRQILTPLDPPILPSTVVILARNPQRFTFTQTLRHTLLLIAFTISFLDQAFGAVPPNDNFANAKVLQGDSVSESSSNTFATPSENGEPISSGYKTLWWRHRPSTNGSLTITTTGSDSFDKILAVYLGTNIASLRLVARYREVGSDVARVSFPVAADTDYQISVGSVIDSGSQAGNIVLGLSLDTQGVVSSLNVPNPATMENDAFAKRVLLIGDAVGAIGYNVSASNEATASEPTFSGQQTLWWTYRTSANGQLTITTTGSDSFDKVLAVYLGTNIASLRLVARYREVGSDVAGVSFPVTANTDYQVSVGSSVSGQAGSIVLGVSLNTQANVSNLNLPVQAAAANDFFANRVPLSGETVSAIGYNPAGGREPNEPSATHEQTVWWTWTALSAGQTLVDLTESDSVSKIVTVWRGASLGTLIPVAASTASPNPQLKFTATAGETYEIAVGNANADAARGSIVMTITGSSATPGSALPDITIDRAIHLRWLAINGLHYQVQKSSDSITWTNIGELVSGNGTFKDFFDVTDQPENFYRIYLQP